MQENLRRVLSVRSEERRRILMKFADTFQKKDIQF